jgi:ribosomal protein S13
MNLFRAWKIIAALTGIFGAGAYTGHVVTDKVQDAPVAQRVSVDEFTHQTMERLRKELKLTPDEFMRVQSHVEEAGLQLDKEYANTLERIVVILDDASLKIRPELNEKQQRNYDQLLSETKARIERKLTSR